MEETSREVERTPGVGVGEGLPEGDDDNKLSEECGWMLDQAAWSTGQAAVASLRWLTGHVPVSCGGDMTNATRRTGSQVHSIAGTRIKVARHKDR
jgi:hypothetical protein